MADTIQSQGKDVYAYLTWRRTKLRRSHDSKLSFATRDDVARDPAQPQRVPLEVEHFRGTMLDRRVEVGVLERRARAADRTRPRRAFTPWQLYEL